ncbi:hypothetical protein [Methylobacterium iners]|uniref:Uncharacterized protein n=1 Tax=Methylobacterium iners TaxID=418707 RepID=A0ABQ4RYU1_9HYPH|nr:hypothetical protein [Methylobacterium iners]GJD94803.1 hypothetical protein OCOJLMKI_2009 [Methylobacterium iners]
MDRTMHPAARSRRHALPLLTLSAALGASAPAAAKPTWTSGTFVYADLCTEADGRRAGHSITLRRSPNGDGITLERGGLPGPVRVETIALDDASREVAFTVETADGPLAFRGVLEAQALTGTLEDGTGARSVRLPRVLRSHAHEACQGETTGSLRR